jgi:hypothetical protein
VIEMERTPVGKQDLDTPGARADAIAGEQRHAARRVILLAIALEDRRAIDDGYVGRCLALPGRRVIG